MSSSRAFARRTGARPASSLSDGDPRLPDHRRLRGGDRRGGSLRGHSGGTGPPATGRSHGGAAVTATTSTGWPTSSPACSRRTANASAAHGASSGGPPFTSRGAHGRRARGTRRVRRSSAPGSRPLLGRPSRAAPADGACRTACSASVCVDPLPASPDVFVELDANSAARLSPDEIARLDDARAPPARRRDHRGRADRAVRARLAALLRRPVRTAPAGAHRRRGVDRHQSLARRALRAAHAGRPSSPRLASPCCSCTASRASCRCTRPRRRAHWCPAGSSSAVEECGHFPWLERPGSVRGAVETSSRARLARMTRPRPLQLHARRGRAGGRRCARAPVRGHRRRRVAI